MFVCLGLGISRVCLSEVCCSTNVQQLSATTKKQYLEVFISELGAIDGFTAGAVKIGKIPALAHKLWDHTVKY